ncbi:hypothetical protein J1605_000028 [Eschrichtius robustus]|uniref:Secreted protein n=1 Tax=Eschrichtius robustus TaxID=9764 RepID=A0AB34I4N0_ESCRO|nr:hypothetical protein J1605_000028 [Eschrichtius robustus]
MHRASLVAQWLGVRLPMQGTWVRAPVREDPTCRGAARPVSHNYWACASGARALQRRVSKNSVIGLPWWCSGYESACQCRGYRFNLWSRKIPHAAEQLSPCAITTEPALYIP